MKLKLCIFIIVYQILIDSNLYAQDTVKYIGNTLSNIDYHHGQLPLAVGVHSIQTMYANRVDSNSVTSWTYNHAPNLAYWNNQFYLNYLSNPVGEHEGAGKTLLQTSTNGYNWNAPFELFPIYKVPDGFVKPGKKDTAKNNFAVMHQRIGFYTSKANQLYALGYYGIVLAPKDDPNDGLGIGRVIRAINKNGSLGPIYFLRINKSFAKYKTDFPFYKNATDLALIKACDEILNAPLLMQQMVEEADRDDSLIPLKKEFKAFSYYRVKSKVVGLWKYALTSVSNDNGYSWTYNPLRAPGFVNANAKIWGQQTSDKKYATVYNPSEFRWPLAVSVSDDGFKYKNLLLINGEISTMRYGGAYKSYGPQYVRGIQEMDGKPKDGSMWVSYSMNKEDMWVSKIPVPIINEINNDVNDDFENKEKALLSFNLWNVFSPVNCNVALSNSGLLLNDADINDYAKIERVFPISRSQQIQFQITPKQQEFGVLEIEVTDNKGIPCLRIVLDSLGNINTKQGYRMKKIGNYFKNQKLHFVIDVDVKTRFYNISINKQKPSTNLLFAPVNQLQRISFRTGETRRFPNADTPTDQSYDVEKLQLQNKSTYIIHNLTTKKFN
jgi:hypothetical protein